MTRDAYVLWILIAAVMYLAGYETAKAYIQPVEKVVYLTGKNDPLCGLKGRKT